MLSQKGTVTKILDQQSGISANDKAWTKQEFVIQTEGEYPKSICFALFGEKCNYLVNLTEGQQVDVFFNLESKEYNGRYFTNINAWKIELIQAENSPAQNSMASGLPPEIVDDLESLPF